MDIRDADRAEYISTHALLAEGDTLSDIAAVANGDDFNPRPPCGGRHGILFIEFAAQLLFQPTPSLRRASWAGIFYLHA